MMNHKLFLSVFVFFILLTLFSLKIPFFWDSGFFSALSVHFYNNGFSGFIAPLPNDTGGFPLFSIYLAFAWKLFGKSLIVSHLVLFPFLTGIAWEYLKLARRFIQEQMLIFPMVLLILQPVFITQSILMGYDIIIAYFFLLALNALFSEKKKLYTIALILLCMISIRGIMLASALFFIDILLNRKRKNFINYIPAILILLIWAIYHRTQTGWYIFSPVRENNAEQFSGTGMMLRQFGYIIWKNIDLGNVVLWLILIGGGLSIKRKKALPQLKEIFLTIFIPLVVLSVFMILIKNPVGHKYFLVIFLLLSIGACHIVQQVEEKKKRALLFSAACISLLAGNFIIYPQQYGNAWDSSLKILPYFSVKEEMDDYVRMKKIDPNSVGTQFPLTQDEHFTNLSDRSFAYKDIEKSPIENFDYFLYSNVINSGRMNEIESIKKTWKEEKMIRQGMVMITLYRNPVP